MTSCTMLSPVISSAEAVVVDLGGRESADLAPVAQNGHALGNLDNLLQP